MNFNSFMRKLDGVEDYEFTDSKTTEARPLDMQGINEFIARRGDNLPHLEERSELSRGRVELFWAGYNGDDYYSSLGVHRNDAYTHATASGFYWLGVGYKLSEGDTHSQQQDSVPPSATGELAGSGWTAPSFNGLSPNASITLDELPTLDLDELNERLRHFNGLFSTVGSTTPSSLTREGPERSVVYTNDDDVESW